MTAKKYKKFMLKKQGLFYYVIIEEDQEGNVRQLMEKPNFKFISPEIHCSGAHIIVDNPKENHYDHYKNGEQWTEGKGDFKHPSWMKKFY